MHNDARRLKAARALGGFDSQGALADALTLPRFGERTIREVELGKRPLFEHEAGAVAAACGISAAFFTIDLEHLDDATPRLSPESAREFLEELLAVADRARRPDEGSSQRSRGDTGHRGEASGGAGG